MRVVVTEKPSVARDLARVLGLRDKERGWIAGRDEDGSEVAITWCFGHMAELVDPAAYDPAWKRWSTETLPMLPERFQLQAREGAAEQLAEMRKLLGRRDLREVINGCDAGREGELIFRYLLELLGVEAPVRRLWVSSMTDQALRQAWRSLREGSRYDPLADAARCRSEADWLMGLNATRAMTLLARSAGGQQLLSVGRVQTPTLAMIVARDQEIAGFVPEDFWQVRARFTVPLPEGERPEGEQAEGEQAEGEQPAGTQPDPSVFLEATWFQPGGLSGTEEDSGEDDEEGGKGDRSQGPSRATRLPSEALAEAVVRATRGGTGTVEEAEFKRQTVRPPLLYDLTSLQRRANQRYGLSADSTLQVAQALYERHKLLTYPRTDARFLTPDQVPELPGIVEGVGKLGVYAPFAQAILAAGPLRPGKRVVDATEVGDHHAIIPTGRTPDGRALSPDEKRIYDLVARRFLAALSAPALFDTAKLVVAVDPVEHPADTGDPVLPELIARPLRYRAKGRVRVEAGWQAVDPPPSKREVVLPPMDRDARLPVLGAKHRASQTRPPPPHNDASILKAMETAGRDLDDTALKRAMRQSGLGTPATRAAILQTLLRRGFVERQGKALRATDRGVELVSAVPVDELKSAELTGRWEARLARMAEGQDERGAFMAAVRARTAEVVAAILAAEPPPAEVLADDREVLGDCPVCGTPVREGRGAYSCAKGRDCSFVVFKKVAKRPIAKTTVKQLLRDGRTPVLNRFRSKAGKEFSAALTLDAEGKVTFAFPPRAETWRDPVGQDCPRCEGGEVIRGRSAWGCSRWREGCDWRREFPPPDEGSATGSSRGGSGGGDGGRRWRKPRRG